jgi:predicted RNA-binding Zn ribbon-like protein
MERVSQADAGPFDLSAGALCLDFANALDGRGSDRPTERLARYGHLVAWGEQAGLLGPDEGRALEKEAGRHPRRAEAARGRAVALREALYRIFSARAAGGDPAPGDLDELNGFLGRALSHLHVRLAPGGPEWSWSAGPGDLDRVLWPVAWSAARLLTSEERERVRECCAATCCWLFLDRSRNRSRRWCDMKVCGNRDKARRHYRKKREAR